MQSTLHNRFLHIKCFFPSKCCSFFEIFNNTFIHISSFSIHVTFLSNYSFLRGFNLTATKLVIKRMLRLSNVHSYKSSSTTTLSRQVAPIQKKVGTFKMHQFIIEFTQTNESITLDKSLKALYSALTSNSSNQYEVST